MENANSCFGRKAKAKGLSSDYGVDLTKAIAQELKKENFCSIGYLMEKIGKLERFVKEVLTE